MENVEVTFVDQVSDVAVMETKRFHFAKVLEIGTEVSRGSVTLGRR